jgi:uridine kinase
MIGDKLVITDYHKQAANQALKFIKERLGTGRFIVSVCGESGSGKSETAEVLCQLVTDVGYTAIVIGQDDYYKKPPKTNSAYRKQHMDWVGSNEVKIDVMNANAVSFREGATEVTKPLVYFDEDRITEQTLGGGPYEVIIVEGTYASLIEDADVRVFIDRTYHQTKKARLRRAREEADGWILEVLEIEHQIISKEKGRADVVIAPPPEEVGLQAD